MKSIKTVLVLAAIILSLSIVAVPGRADGDTSVNYMRSAVLSSEVNGTFDGFDLPEDVKLLVDSSKTPLTEGNKVTDLVGLSGNMCLRTAFAEGSESISVLYDLKKEKQADSTDSSAEDIESPVNADSVSEDGTTAVENDKEDPAEVSEGTRISGLLAFGIYVSSASKSEEKLLTVSVSLRDSDGNDYICDTTLYTDRPYVIYTDPKADPDAEFESVSIVISRSSGTDELMSILSLPSTTDSVKLDFLESCQLRSIVSHKGKVHLERDLITLGTDESDVILSVLPEHSSTDDRELVSFLTVDCTVGEGTVMSVSDDRLTTYSSHAIYSGSGIVPVRTVRHGNDAVDLSFRSSKSQAIVLKSISYYPTDELYSYDGSFTTLVYDDGKINATGKLSTRMINEYSDATIGLYTVAESSRGEVILLDEIKMTSRFSFSASLEKYPHAHTDNTFFVAIINKDEIIPVTKQRFVSAQSSTDPSTSILGLHGANPISVFESGVSSVLVDVDLSMLISPVTSSGVTMSRSGFTYGINSDYLSKLDSDISFYRSIGASVQLRYICTKDLRSSGDGSWLTYDGLFESELMLRGDMPEALNIYPAATALLSQRYDNISSYVISSGVNSVGLTGISHNNAWDSVSDVALIARLIYGAASDYLPDISISIPFKLSGDDLYIDAETFAALLGERLSSIGDIPWNLVYTADGDSPSVLCENIKSALRLNGGSSPIAFTVIYEADALGGNSTANYEKYCDACSKSSVSRVFLSVKNIGDTLSRESYSALKNYASTSGSFAGTAQGIDKIPSDTITGSMTLWNFSTTYSHEGWNAGYGMTALQSASLLEEDHSRVLRAITDPASPAGIFLCSLNEKLNIKDVHFAEFTFDLDADDSARIVIIFGNESSRAEFALDEASAYESGGKLHAVCDLSGYAESAGSVSYMGVIIYSDERAIFDLARVDIHSTTLDSEALKGSAVTEAEEEDDKSSYRLIVGCAFVAVVLLLAATRITSVLADHDAKNKAIEAEKKKEKRSRKF